jgi:NRPS condensation-like uncharacterized protein
VKRIRPPHYLPLNVNDRQFLVPETDDFAHGPYLPMTPITVVRLKSIPSVEVLQDALILLDNNCPQFRLSYTLDPIFPRWIRVSEENRMEYLKGLVLKAEVDTLDEHISTYINHNLYPFESPIKVFICNDSLCVHRYHPFGDGRFVSQLVACLLMALYKPECLKQVNGRFSVPLREVVMSSVPQTIKVSGYMAKRMFQKATSYFSGFTSPSTRVDSDQSVYQATVSGTKMSVLHVEIPPDRMSQIRSIVQSLPTKQRISLNTYWQIYFAFRMNELGFVDWPIELTAQVNLRRYLKNPSSYYPGNCIGNIRLAINKAAFVDACSDYQARLAKQIDSAYPLTDTVGTWLLSLAGDPFFKRAMRDWYLKISPRENRFFTLSNIGRVDDIFEPVSEYILPDVRFFIPIMGSAPLVIAFSSLNDHGHFSVTYKSDILSKDDVLHILGF